MKLNDARRQLVDAISVLPSGSNAYLLLGRVECLLGEYEHAVQTFGTYILLKPNNELGYIESGFANEHNGDEQAALRQWRSAGLSFNNFTDVGDSLRDAEQFEESNDWYRRGSAILGKMLDDYQGLNEKELNVLESFASQSHWLAYPNNSSGIFRAEDGILTMAYKNNLEKRDLFSYYTVIDHISISNYHEILIRLKGQPDTYFTFETVIDGKRSRPINYQHLPENWEVWSIPVSGAKLSNLTIGVSENKAETIVNEYFTLIDWIAMR